jgi:hypothetical protein
MIFVSTAEIDYIEETISIYSRRGAENNYRYKGRVTRDKEKQGRYPPLSYEIRANQLSSFSSTTIAVE